MAREVRSFLMPRDPSIDRRFRPCPERQVNLFKLISEAEEDESYGAADEECISVASTYSSGSSTAVGEGALIYLRLRPVEHFSRRYQVTGNVLVTASDDIALNKQNTERHFTFTDIFDNSVNQAEVFETCLRNKIDTDENFTIMTYGTSGSGKTFTLLGDFESPGVIPRALENIFTLYANNIFPSPFVKIVNASISILDDIAVKKEDTIRKNLLANCSDVQSVYKRVQAKIQDSHSFETKNLDNLSVYIYVSFVELYNEFVYDLLTPVTTIGTLKRKNHRIVSNDGKVFIKDLTSVHVKTAGEAYRLLTYGLQRVKYASTAINSNSSRSHCIFFVDVIKYSHPDIFTNTSYRFCDLAGSERLGKTGNVGDRLKEAQSINTSLMVLGRCLDAANNNQKKKNADMIPFRESKLTMLLQSAVLGKEKLTMIVNITPTENYFEENLNVLGFSSIAKNIVFKPQQQVKNSMCTRYSWFSARAVMGEKSSTVDNSEFETLYEENITLRSEIERLNGNIEQLEKELVKQEVDLRNKLIDGFQETLKDKNKRWEERLLIEQTTSKQLLKEKMELRAQHEMELEELAEEASKAKEDLEFEVAQLKKQLNRQNEDENANKKRRITLSRLENVET